MRKISRCIVVPLLPTGHHSDPPQKERRQRELEHEKKEKEAKERKEELEVRRSPVSDRTPF